MKNGKAGGWNAFVGGLGPFKIENVLPAQARSLKKKKRRDPQRQSTNPPPGTTLLGSTAPSAPQRRSIGLNTGAGTDQMDMGQGMMTGSNTLQANGPANLFIHLTYLNIINIPYLLLLPQSTPEKSANWTLAVPKSYKSRRKTEVTRCNLVTRPALAAPNPRRFSLFLHLECPKSCFSFWKAYTLGK